MRLGFFVICFITIFINVSCNKKKNKRPIDFDKFWDRTIVELNKTPLEFEKISKDSILEGKKFSLYKIKSFQDIYFYSWISEPVEEGKYPIKIRFSGFGKGVSAIDSFPHVWFLKQKKTINMIVDIRGQGLSIEQISFKNYLTNGIKNKESYIYRGAYMDAVRSVNFIAKNHKSNGNIIVTGGGQGGSLSIVAAALNKKVTMCVVGFPFLTDIDGYDKNKWPMNIMIHHSIRNDIDFFDLMETLSYFDMLNFADKINAPIFLRTEGTDEITPPEGAITFFRLLKNQKKVLYIEPCSGHGCSTNSIVANEMEKIFIHNNLITKEN